MDGSVTRGTVAARVRRDMTAPYDDGDMIVQVQGSCVVVQVASHRPQRGGGNRGDVTWFSKASRLRLLRLTNSLDFGRMGRCTFLTLTWPDAVYDRSPRKITLARSLMQRHVERISGGHRPGIWRTEWCVRHSGNRKGHVYPHVHALYYGCPWMDKRQIADAWRSSLSYHKKIRTRIEEVRNVIQCGHYVSKYVAKTTSAMVSLSLAHISATDHQWEDVPEPGRQWGLYRRDELPWADRTVKILRSGSRECDDVREAARRAWSGVSEDARVGFTLLGQDAAQEVKKAARMH